MNNRILIVDGDPKTVWLVCDALKGSNWTRLVARDGEEALNTFSRESPDLVVVDLSVSKINGFKLCRKIRKSSVAPILILSHKASYEEKVKCFRLGANDYIAKPLNIVELSRHIKSLLCRARQTTKKYKSSTLTSGDISIDFDKRAVFLGEHEISLTSTEFNLLKELMINAGKCIKHADLLQKVWGRGFEDATQCLYVHIGQLRTKLDAISAGTKRIVTVRGIGYMFQPSCSRIGDGAFS